MEVPSACTGTNPNPPRTHTVQSIREKHSLSSRYLEILDSFWEVYGYVRLIRRRVRTFCTGPDGNILRIIVVAGFLVYRTFAQSVW